MIRHEKLKKLKTHLKSLKSVLLAYSGGVDSSFLLKVASDVLGDKVLAVTALSETYPALEAEKARTLAEKLKVRLEMIRTHELRDPRFRRNPENRCFLVKKLSDNLTLFSIPLIIWWVTSLSLSLIQS